MICTEPPENTSSASRSVWAPLPPGDYDGLPGSPQEASPTVGSAMSPRVNMVDMSGLDSDGTLAPSVNESGRRSPTASELRAWRAFIETSEAAKHLVALRLQKESGLSTGDYAVMVALYDQPGHGMRSSQLAETISWERSRLSHHLGRMERRCLISRQAVAGDNRGAEVSLTAQGAHLYRRASSPHLHAVRDIFVAPLSVDQLSLLEDAMRSLAAHLASLG